MSGGNELRIRMSTRHGTTHAHLRRQSRTFADPGELVHVMAHTSGKVLVEYPSRPRLHVGRIGHSRRIRPWDWLPVEALAWE